MAIALVVLAAPGAAAGKSAKSKTLKVALPSQGNLSIVLLRGGRSGKASTAVKIKNAAALPASLAVLQDVGSLGRRTFVALVFLNRLTGSLHVGEANSAKAEFDIGSLVKIDTATTISQSGQTTICGTANFLNNGVTANINQAVIQIFGAVPAPVKGGADAVGRAALDAPISCPNPPRVTTLNLLYQALGKTPTPIPQAETEFGTWLGGMRTNNVCIYVNGPAGQMGTVTLEGPSAGLPATFPFTLDVNGQARVDYNAGSAGTYTYTVIRTGSTTHTGTVTVATTGNGPPAADPFQMTSCPTPP